MVKFDSGRKSLISDPVAEFFPGELLPYRILVLRNAHQLRSQGILADRYLVRRVRLRRHGDFPVPGGPCTTGISPVWISIAAFSPRSKPDNTASIVLRNAGYARHSNLRVIEGTASGPPASAC